MIDNTENTVEDGYSRLTYESAFESLQNPRRRRTLQYLSGRGRPADVGELADHITADEEGVAVAEISPSARKSVYNSLCQTHLPQLASHGIVEYDQEAGTVELAPNAGQLANYVPQPGTDDYHWSLAFLAVASVGGLAVAANSVGLLAVPTGTLNVALAGLFFAVSLLYAIASRR